MTRFKFVLIGVAALGVPAAHVTAGSHLWRFNELFTNADRTIQFIEMKECCGASGERLVRDKWIRSASGGEFVFPDHLVGDTANRHLLLATAGFAALPGAPTPDFIIDEAFFALVEDEMTYWMYEAARFNYAAGDLPSDGITALNIDLTNSVNSPTNFAEESGSVVVSCHPADLDADGEVTFADLLTLLSSWGECLCPADFDRSGAVDFIDLLEVLGGWGPCS